MKNVSVTIERRITVNLSASDWFLYTRMEGIEEIAKQINYEVEYAINRSETKGFAARQIAKTLEDFSKYGANDTEPVAVASQILNKAYPEYDGWETTTCV
jgi:hypothetical protein